MSTHKHATISAWQREEHGGYKAEINGWLLRVHWHPETVDGKTKQRGFSWDAKHGDLPRFVSRDVHEEIELAMAAAEAYATEAYPAEAEEAAAAARKAEAEAADTDAGH